MSYLCVHDRTLFYNPSNKYCIISVKTTDATIPQQAYLWVDISFSVFGESGLKIGGQRRIRTLHDFTPTTSLILILPNIQSLLLWQIERI